MNATTAMEVNAEARRILAVSISKLYASRAQRGGLRLHRGLLLSVVMRSARDIYHSSRECDEPCAAQPTTEELMETACGPEEQPALPEPVPEQEPQPAGKSAEPHPEESDSEDDGSDGETAEDKENISPARQSRKRRGKASVAPDFLPSKRARLEPGEERHAAPPSSCRTGAGESLAALSLNRVIPAF
ncbi:immediate early response gene 2 protein [Pungitius pungitius]|uniref:immediate early response gene 2 protein n=1 Tax=Pungitius pungitius TaxID=134920 RepID=UPI002E129F09